MKIDFSGKCVLISGGSRGIGAACVNFFSSSSANVHFIYKSDVVSAKNILRMNNNRLVTAHKCDITKEKAVKNLVKKIVSHSGPIHILVNNAGIWEGNLVHKMTLKEWNKTMETNMTGTFLLTREVLPYMMDSGFGRIINISSTAGQRGEAGHSHYAASKGAMISWTKSLATELAQYGILTNCVAPGWVDTDMSASVLRDRKQIKNVLKAIPTGKVSTAEDIAGAVLFLASEFAGNINGEILNVNGGSVLCG